MSVLFRRLPCVLAPRGGIRGYSFCCLITPSLDLCTHRRSVARFLRFVPSSPTCLCHFDAKAQLCDTPANRGAAGAHPPGGAAAAPAFADPRACRKVPTDAATRATRFDGSKFVAFSTLLPPQGAGSFASAHAMHMCRSLPLSIKAGPFAAASCTVHAPKRFPNPTLRTLRQRPSTAKYLRYPWRRVRALYQKPGIGHSLILRVI